MLKISNLELQDNEAAIIKVTGKVVKTTPANGNKFTLEELQAAIGGGYVEQMPAKLGKHRMLADEEGTLKGMTPNVVASMLTGFRIVGDVLVVGKGMM